MQKGYSLPTPQAEQKTAGQIQTLAPKLFNIYDIYDPGVFYHLPRLTKLPFLTEPVDLKQYVVLKGPKKSGKTIMAREYARHINARGLQIACFFPLEKYARFADTDLILKFIAKRCLKNLWPHNIDKSLKQTFLDIIKTYFKTDEYGGPEPDLFIPAADTFGRNSKMTLEKKYFSRLTPKNVLTQTLRYICRKLDRELVLFFDDVDTLDDRTLAAFLSQLSAGYRNRDKYPFPQTVFFLCRHDITAKKPLLRNRKSLKADPFDIIHNTLTLPMFDLNDIVVLVSQHARATGKPFDSFALERLYKLSGGQPWIVNFLAREILELKKYRLSEINRYCVTEAIDAMANGHCSLIDYCMSQLNEPQVQKVLQAVIGGFETDTWASADDVRHCLEIGLVRQTDTGHLTMANPIYCTAMFRNLTASLKNYLTFDAIGRFVDHTGADISGMLSGMQTFFRFNSQILDQFISYPDCRTLLAIKGFMLKSFNDRVRIRYSLRTGSHKLSMIAFFKTKPYFMEIRLKDSPVPLAKSLAGLKQDVEGMKAKEGWILNIDPDKEKTWAEKLTWDTKTFFNSTSIHVVGF
jgi:hypothetical protein